MKCFACNTEPRGVAVCDCGGTRIDPIPYGKMTESAEYWRTMAEIERECVRNLRAEGDRLVCLVLALMAYGLLATAVAAWGWLI